MIEDENDRVARSGVTKNKIRHSSLVARHSIKYFPFVLLALLAFIFTAHVLSPAEGWALGTYDMRGLFYPWWESLRNALFRGEIPWWDGRQLAGNPFLANPQIAFFYPLTWVAILPPLNSGISLYATVHLWLAGAGMYLFVKEEGRRSVEEEKRRSAFAHDPTLPRLFAPFIHFPHYPALLAAATFMFSGFFAARLLVGHSGLIAVHVWLPWLLWGTDRALLADRAGSWRWVGWAALFFCMALLAGHITSVVYIGFIWGAYGLWIGIERREERQETEEDEPNNQSATDNGQGITDHTESLNQPVNKRQPPVPDHRIPNTEYRTLVTGYWSLFSSHRSLLTLKLATVPLLGLLLSAVQLLPTAQLIRFSGRSGSGSFEFATEFSFPPAHLLTLLVPEFFGEPTQAGYWSVPNFEELAIYIGVLPILALILTLMIRPTKRSWFYIGLILLGILLALGRYGFLYRLLYNWVPPFRVMRAPGRAMFFYVFAGSALVGELLYRLQNGHFRVERERLAAVLRWLTLLFAALGLVTVAAVGAVFAAQHPSETSGRLWHQMGGWLWAFGGLAMATWLMQSVIGEARDAEIRSGEERLLNTDGRRPLTGHRSLATVYASLFLLILIDLWTFGYKLLQVESMTPDIVWRESQQLIEDRDDWRILPWGLTIFEQNGASQVGVDSVFGYNTLELAALTDMTGAAADPTSHIYDVLGVGYVIANVSLNQFLEGDEPFELAYRGEQTRIYRRPNRLPLARLVTGYEVIPESGAALARLQAADFNPSNTVILAQDPVCPALSPSLSSLSAADAPEAAGVVSILSRASGRWSLQVDATTDAILVLSEIAYPGWEVTIDGQTAAWQTAYTGLRAVCVPAGEHLVEWRFVPRIFRWGGLLSFIGLLLTLGLISVGFYFENRDI